MYFYYLFVISRNGAKGLPGFQDIQGFFLGDDDKFVRGPRVASAVLCLFSAAVMTVSKTVLYCKSIRLRSRIICHAIVRNA